MATQERVGECPAAAAGVRGTTSGTAGLQVSQSNACRQGSMILDAIYIPCCAKRGASGTRPAFRNLYLLSASANLPHSRPFLSTISSRSSSTVWFFCSSSFSKFSSFSALLHVLFIALTEETGFAMEQEK